MDSTKPENLISYTNIEVDGNVLENIGDYKADGDISFNIGQDYTDVDGIVTFRGNSFRDTPSHGYADMTDFRLNKLWSADTGSLSSGRVDHIGVRPHEIHIKKIKQNQKFYKRNIKYLVKAYHK